VEQRLLDRSGNLDGCKSGSGIQIVLTALVYDVYVAVGCSILIGHNEVNLVQLQGGFVARVADADNKLRRSVPSFAHSSIQIAFTFDFLSSNAMRFVPVQLCQADPAGT